MSICTYMGSKNISIRDEAYDLLKKLQLKDESFSDTIIRLSRQFGNIKDSFGTGTLSPETYEDEVKSLIESRKTIDVDREIA